MKIALENGTQLELDDGSSQDQINDAVDHYTNTVSKGSNPIDQAFQAKKGVLGDEKSVASPFDAVVSTAGGYLDAFPGTRRVAAAIGATGADLINQGKNAYNEATGNSERKDLINPFGSEALGVVDDTINSGRDIAPGSYYTGLGAGAVGSIAAGLQGASQVAIPATRLARFGQATLNAGKSAAIGGLYGADQARSFEELPQSAATGAALGFAAPIVIPKAIGAIGEIGDTIGLAAKGAFARNSANLADRAGELKQVSSQSYQAMKDIGSTFSPQSSTNIASSVVKDVKDDGILNSGLHGKTISILDDFQKAAQQPDFDLEKLDQWRQLLGQVAGNKTPDNLQDARKATLAINALDDVVDNIKNTDLTNGSVEAIDALNLGRAQYRKAAKFQTITDIINNSGGDANKLKNGLDRLLTNSKKSRGFTGNELDALKSASQNTTTEGILKWLGKFGIDLGSARAAGSSGALAAIPTLLAGATVGGGTAGATLAGGTIARQAQKYVARGKAEQLLKVIEKGGSNTAQNQIQYIPQQVLNRIDIQRAFEARKKQIK